MPQRPKSNYPNNPSGRGTGVPAAGAYVPDRRLGATPISPSMTGFSGGPSASADVQFSRLYGQPLTGCPDPRFPDCEEDWWLDDPDEKDDDMFESLRSFIKTCILENKKDDDHMIDEDDLEEDDEIEEYSGLAAAGGGAGEIKGYTLPLGKKPRSFSGSKRKAPWKAAASGFGGAALAGKKHKNKN